MGVMVLPGMSGRLPPAHGAAEEGMTVEDLMMYDPALYWVIDELPTLAVGQADDLKIDTRELSVAVRYPDGVDGIQVWTHRPEPGYVNVERREAGRWVTGTALDVTTAVEAAAHDGLL